MKFPAMYRIGLRASEKPIDVWLLYLIMRAAVVLLALLVMSGCGQSTQPLPLKPDASQESVTHPDADASEEPAFAWSHRGDRADVSMRDLLDHFERQHRRRTA